MSAFPNGMAAAANATLEALIAVIEVVVSDKARACVDVVRRASAVDMAALDAAVRASDSALLAPVVRALDGSFEDARDLAIAAVCAKTPLPLYARKLVACVGARTSAPSREEVCALEDGHAILAFDSDTAAYPYPSVYVRTNSGTDSMTFECPLCHAVKSLSCRNDWFRCSLCSTPADRGSPPSSAASIRSMWLGLVLIVPRRGDDGVAPVNESGFLYIYSSPMRSTSPVLTCRRFVAARATAAAVARACTALRADASLKSTVTGV